MWVDIFTVLRQTYKKVTKATVASALGLQDPSSFLQEKGQKVEGDDVLMTPESSEPQAASIENIPFSRILSTLA